MEILSEPWGTLENRNKVHLFTLTDEITVKVSNYGAMIVSVQAPDRSGDLGEVVLGFDSLEGYLKNKDYHGATIGRYANRIAGGSFELEGENYSLATNNPPNHLHGGLKGFDKVVWQSELVENGVRFAYHSVNGEEGYPGDLDVSVTFTLEGDSLSIEYRAETSKTTVVNLTNHAYFNLKGIGTILDHWLWVDSEYYSPVDENLIPLGKHEPVAGSAFDFTIETQIGKNMELDSPQLELANGIDHNFILNQITNPQALLSDKESGRVLKVSTTMPGVQIYTGNFLDGTMIGRNGSIEQRNAICLETQFFPDSPNQPEYPSTVLKPGEKYLQKTVYRFTTMK